MAKRERGMGRVYLRGATWWIAIGVNGTEHRESSKSDKKSDAVRLLHQRHSEIMAGTFHPDPARCTFEDLERLVKEDGLNKGNRSDRQERVMALLGKSFAGMRASDISAASLDQYVRDRRAEGIASGTIKRELSVLKRGFRLAARRNLLKSIPAFPELEQGAPREGFLEDKEMKVILANLPDYMRPAVELLWLSGWRKAEVFNLRWAAVDLEQCVVRLESSSSKNKRPRELFYRTDPDMLRIFTEQRALADRLEEKHGLVTPWVFPRVTGLNSKKAEPKVHSIGSGRKAWTAACEEAKCPGKLIHDLRRTAVRRLSRAGIPDTVSMSLTGHLTHRVFDAYNITSAKDREDAVARAAAFRREVAQ